MPASVLGAAKVAYSLTVGEGFTNPLGFHDAAPIFSWKLPEGVQRQTAYQIEARIGRGAVAKVVWDSGLVESEQSTFVPFGGAPLPSRERVEWRVRFRDETGVESDWSETAHFEMGLLSAADWTAQWIRPAADTDLESEPVSWLRRSFSAEKAARARLYVTARGVFEIKLNNSRVSQDYLANGWTSYHHRLDTLTYDVTELLRDGENVLLVALGTGWYAGRIGWSKGQRGYYGQNPELLLQLEITGEEGAVQTIVSDGNWEATFDGPILSSSLYDGENYDARREISVWAPVAANPERDSARLVPKPFAPVRETQTLAPQAITEPQPGRYVFDLGQNMVGWPRLTIPVEKDQTVTIRFAEMLNSDGTTYTDNYRSARSIDTYTAAETGTITWEPTFTFHGFRYVELSGLPENVTPQTDWVTGIVLHSDLRKSGTFESSHALLNQLQSNITWGQRGNFLDIPTDCPQRDERMGWTGDAQVFCPTSMFNYDCHAFWKSWLGSMRDDQTPSGQIPNVIPDVLGCSNSPGWMDAATFIPWEVYVRTGDTQLLSENFDMMERLVALYRSQATDGITTTIAGYGDWLQPYAEKTKGDTPFALLGTAYYAYDAKILADTATVLGKADEAKRYAAEYDFVRRSFTKHYFNTDGRLQNAPETQTAYLLAIAFDLIPAKMQAKAAANLVRLIEEVGGHLRTGFLGTPYIVSVLDRMGYRDLAFDLLLKETYPSWFYSIHQGATTMWERWNSYSHESGFGDVGMNSFNHYAYGAIGQWMYERLAGLTPNPTQPGYKHFFVRPLTDKRFDFARAEYETPYGRASSGWKRENGTITLEFTVPPNTTATVEFPNGTAKTVPAGSYRYDLEAAKSLV